MGESGWRKRRRLNGLLMSGEKRNGNINRSNAEKPESGLGRREMA